MEKKAKGRMRREKGWGKRRGHRKLAEWRRERKKRMNRKRESRDNIHRMQRYMGSIMCTLTLLTCF